jgi:NhaA family Na+:H+ antiporter
LLLGGAILAMILANSPMRHFYAELSSHPLGGSAFGLHLRLSLSGWAADGLLAIFFFVAGLELKREFVTGELRDPRQAVLPVVAAACGVAVPALLFLLVSFSTPGASRGWAIPTATDIAFALAVLGIVGSHLPASLRAFLLTLAVVDDLIAIAIIAFVYTSSVSFGYLLGAFIPLALFAFISRLALRTSVLVPLLVLCAVACWALVHESGVHATVAGVLLGLVVRVRAGDPFAGQVEHAIRPLSAGFAVPVFAFFAAGVSVTAAGGFGASMRDSVTLGVIAGLVAGKAIGITGATWLVQRFTRARLDPGLSWWDVIGLALLGGVGFTVSLLIGELAYGSGTVRDGHAKIGVLTGSLLAAMLAAVVLRLRDRHYRRIAEEEALDADDDGIPDVYQR